MAKQPLQLNPAYQKDSLSIDLSYQPHQLTHPEYQPQPSMNNSAYHPEAFVFSPPNFNLNPAFQPDRPQILTYRYDPSEINPAYHQQDPSRFNPAYHQQDPSRFNPAYHQQDPSRFNPAYHQQDPSRINQAYQPDEEYELSFTLPRLGVNREFVDPKENVNIYPVADGNVRKPNCDSSMVANDIHPFNSSSEVEDYSLLSYFPCWKGKQSSNNPKMKKITKMIIQTLILVLYVSYFCAAVIINSDINEETDYWCEGDGFLIILTSIFFTGLFYFKIFKPSVGRLLYKSWKNYYANTKELQKLATQLNKGYVSRSVYASVIAAFVIFLIVDTAEDRSRLISFGGILALLLIGFLFSAAPRKVVWRHVIWGMGLQLIMGLIILRWPVGRATFECLGDKVSAFLSFTDKGTAFVFQDIVTKMGIFAFKVLSIIIFFSFCIQILYYYGVMQWLVLKIGWFLQVTVGTTVCESVNAAANIFIGQSEAPLLIKPYLADMTKSEIHAVMTGGFATVSGTILGAYIKFDISASHLLSASVMSAPAALAFSKLFYPEVEVSRTSVKDIRIVKGTEANALHAAIEGVTTAIPLIANITANLIAFIAFISFFDGVFNWSCTLLDIQDGVCTSSNIMGYILMPLAWILGVQWSDCYYVGQLIGTKTILNEFIAYLQLRDYIHDNSISERSQIIATYALCGFSNIASIGIQIGALGSLVPERKGDIAMVGLRSMIAGNMACFLTACVAGTLLSIDGENAANGLLNNSTASS